MTSRKPCSSSSSWRYSQERCHVDRCPLCSPSLKLSARACLFSQDAEAPPTESKKRNAKEAAAGARGNGSSEPKTTSGECITALPPICCTAAAHRLHRRPSAGAEGGETGPAQEKSTNPATEPENEGTIDNEGNIDDGDTEQGELAPQAADRPSY